MTPGDDLPWLRSPVPAAVHNRFLWVRKEGAHLGEHLGGVWQHLPPAPTYLNLGSEASTVVSTRQTFTVAIIPPLASCATCETLLMLAWAAF